MPKAKEPKTAAASTIPKSQVLGRSQKEAKKTTTDAEFEEGPERFAPWYPLLQRIQRNNRNPQHNHLNLDPTAEADLEFVGRCRSPDPPAYVNIPVPSAAFPTVQLQNGVLPPPLSKEPKNLRWLQTRLSSARDMPDWTAAKWQTYMIRAYSGTTKEAIMCEMRPLFQEYANQPEYVRTFRQRFYEFPEYAPFNQGLPKPRPGFAQGFRSEAFRGVVDINYLRAAVCFRYETGSLALPHIAGEFAYGDWQALEAVSARHGAALVYMRNIALTHAKKKDMRDVAEITTFITNGLWIRFYAHYASASDDGEVEYHQYPIQSVNLVGSYAEFIHGVTMLRNCQDHAFLVASRLRDILKAYHAKNGIDAWTYPLNEGEHILSESEDGEIGHWIGRKTLFECKRQDVQGQSEGWSTRAVENYPSDSETSSDGYGDGSSDDGGGTDYEDDSPAPTFRNIKDTIQLRPRRRAAQVEKSSGRCKRQAEGVEEAPRKRRR